MHKKQSVEGWAREVDGATRRERDWEGPWVRFTWIQNPVKQQLIRETRQKVLEQQLFLNKAEEEEFSHLRNLGLLLTQQNSCMLSLWRTFTELCASGVLWKYRKWPH